MSIIQSNKGKPILYIFQTKNGIKYLDKTKIYFYHPNNLNTYFTYEDTDGNIHYIKIENGTVRDVVFDAKTVKKYQNTKEKDKDGNEVPIDWEGILKVEADNAFEYDNLTDQDIENIYNIIDGNGGTENRSIFEQDLDMLLNNKDVINELEKFGIYRDYLVGTTEEGFE